MSNAPPSGLSPEAAGWWTALQKEYHLDDAAGRLILQTGLEALDRLREAQAAIARDGAVVPDRFGQMKPHPSIQVERDARRDMLTALQRLDLEVQPRRDAPGRPAGSFLVEAVRNRMGPGRTTG